MGTGQDRVEPSGHGSGESAGLPPWEVPARDGAEPVEARRADDGVPPWEVPARDDGEPGGEPAGQPAWEPWALSGDERYGAQWAGDGGADAPLDDTGHRRRPWGCIVASLLAVAVVGGIAVGVDDIVKKFPDGGVSASAGASTGGTTGNQAASSQPGLTQSPSPADLTAAGQVTSQFLQAWAAGDAARAAALTDDPHNAQAALTAYRSGLHLRKLVLAPGAGQPANPGDVPSQAQSASVAVEYQVAAGATVAAGQATGIWSYHTQLLAYKLQGRWRIAWQPADLAPNLDAGQHLAAVALPAGSGTPTATDSSGNPLSGYGDPGLSAVAAKISPQAATAKGAPGLEVDIEDASDTPLDGMSAAVTPPKPPKAATTINESAEKAARAAVQQYPGSAMVAIQPSTGHILAIANNAQDNDFALTAQVSPGSVMKIVTATALLNAGTVTTNTPVSCPPAETVGMQTFSNDAGESEPAGTPFATDFAMSCNNAFTQFEPQLSGGRLASAARDYYGLGLPWSLGLAGQPATYFSEPSSPSAAELAEESFGEGSLTTCPLAMASVAATVDTGQFRQPELVQGMASATASPLPAGTDEQLQAMMREVVTEGTAASVGFGPDVYAKTGTADIDGQEQANAWLAAYDPAKDVAVAALVLNSGDGAAVAGPEVRSFLSQY